MPEWVWHPKSQQWRIWSPTERKWVLQDGTRVPPTPEGSEVGEESEGNLDEQESYKDSESEDEAEDKAEDEAEDLPEPSEPRSDLTNHGGYDTVPDITDALQGLVVTPEPPVQIIYSDPQVDEDWKQFQDPVLLVQGARSFTRISAGSQEKLDPRFKYRSSNFFSRGKVFKVLWPEPRGDLNSRITIVSGPFGEGIAVKIRWFVVIRPNKGYCSCLPIQTYGGRGVAKKQGMKSDHAIIYTGNTEPKQRSDEYPSKDEDPMLAPGIRVDTRSRTDKLDPMSRINFNKIYTIEHNVKVYEFGDVHRDSLRTFQKHFQACWQIDEEAARKGKALAAYIAQQEDKQVAEVNKAAEESVTASMSDSDDDQTDGNDAHWEADALNRVVAHCVKTWRASTDPVDHDRAQYLSSANTEEQKAYLKMMGVDPSTQSQSAEQTAASTQKRRRRR